MKSISNVAILFMVAVVLVCAAGWHKSSKALGDSAQALTTVSNKMNEVTAKLAEKEAAIATLHIQQSLQATDLGALTNQVDHLKTAVIKALEAGRKVTAEADRLAADFRTATGELETARQGTSRLRQELESLRAELAATQAKFVAGQKLVADLRATLNASEVDRTQLLQQWNDNAALRAQLKEISRMPATDAGQALAKERPKLAIQSDGSVLVEVQPRP